MEDGKQQMQEPGSQPYQGSQGRAKRPAWLCCACLVLLLSLGVTLGATAKTNSPWDRIVMIGASVSAGFTASEPLGGPITPRFRLSRYVDAALVAPHQPVENLANTFFFITPELMGRQQVDRALKANPTLVLGVDFLFWFCYGEGATDQERLQRFEKGLKLLEPFDCPLVLGDIPDASAAVDGMLRREQIPGTNAMAAANLRLKKWAATRPNVVVLRLSEFMRTVMANQAIAIHDYTLPEGKTRVLLQDDKLHSSPPGCAVLVLAALDALQAKHRFRSDDVRWDPKEILRLGLKSLQAGTNSPPNPTPSPK
jgi:hypothetical protein